MPIFEPCTYYPNYLLLDQPNFVSLPTLQSANTTHPTSHPPTLHKRGDEIFQIKKIIFSNWKIAATLYLQEADNFGSVRFNSFNLQLKFIFKCTNFTLKACVRYFLSNFYFFIKWQPFKNYEKRFLFHLKSSFHTWDIQIFIIFSLPFQTSQIQKGKWKWNNLWCHELVCINLQM